MQNDHKQIERWMTTYRLALAHFELIGCRLVRTYGRTATRAGCDWQQLEAIERLAHYQQVVLIAGSGLRCAGRRTSGFFVYIHDGKQSLRANE